METVSLGADCVTDREVRVVVCRVHVDILPLYCYHLNGPISESLSFNSNFTNKLKMNQTW